MSKDMKIFHTYFTVIKLNLQKSKKRDARAKHEAPHDKGEGKS